MAVVAIKKVQIISLKSSARKVLSLLQKKNAFEPVSKENKTDDAKSLEELRHLEKKVADLEFVIKFLSKYSSVKSNFKYALIGNKEIFSEKRIEEIVSQCNFETVVLDVLAWV